MRKNVYFHVLRVLGRVWGCLGMKYFSMLNRWKMCEKSRFCGSQGRFCTSWVAGPHPSERRLRVRNFDFCRVSICEGRPVTSSTAARVGRGFKDFSSKSPIRSPLDGVRRAHTKGEREREGERGRERGKVSRSLSLPLQHRNRSRRGSAGSSVQKGGERACSSVS